MRKVLLFFSLLAVLVMVQNTAGAQSWKWGKRGGSNAGTTGPDETVEDMATDPNGNVYVLAIGGKSGTVGPIAYNIDGNSKTGQGGEDIILFVSINNFLPIYDNGLLIRRSAVTVVVSNIRIYFACS